MKITLTDRQNAIVSSLRSKDGGNNAIAFDHLEKGELVVSEIDALCNLINDEFMMEGILPNFEPNDYGRELERLLNIINKPRLIT